MKRILVTISMLLCGTNLAVAEASQSDLVGQWSCHEGRDGTSQTSQITYRDNGRFKIKFEMRFTDSPDSKGMRGTMSGKWDLSDRTISMLIQHSRATLTAKGGGAVSLSNKTSRSEIVEFDNDRMVLMSEGGAGPMTCNRLK
ncbi:hypothetical protein [Profundibacter sp.]|uniref:hypothetical protein n=1 Tax=Profundibacter sp. TaxID=3101071 RepID=UPI003D0EDB0B